jgi:hypothetical protein
MGIEVDGPLVTTAAEKELTAGAARLAGDEAVWLDALADYDDSGEWSEHGFFACSTWLAAACGIARITAREKLRVARGLRRLRGVRAAFRAGRISYSAVRAITRIDDMNDEMEQALLDTAANGTVEDLEYLAKVWREYRNQDLATATMRRQERKRDTRAVHLGDGFKLDSVLPADEGELLLSVLHQAAGDAPAETPLGDRLTDGLLALADHWRTHTRAPRRRCRRFSSRSTSRRSAANGTGPRSPADPYPPRRPAGSPATPRSPGCSPTDGPNRSTSAGRPGSCPPGYGERSTRETAAAPFPAAGDGTTSTPTMSSTGSTTARRRCGTWCCYAVATTASSTRASGTS